MTEPAVQIPRQPTLPGRSKAIVAGETNMLLQEISAYVQSLPIPVMEGCNSLLRQVVELWKNNSRVSLVTGSLKLIFIFLLTKKLIFHFIIQFRIQRRSLPQILGNRLLSRVLRKRTRSVTLPLYGAIPLSSIQQEK